MLPVVGPVERVDHQLILLRDIDLLGVARFSQPRSFGCHAVKFQDFFSETWIMSLVAIAILGLKPEKFFQ